MDNFGEQLRRVCRYYKGWRDHQWETCRLASIALMSAVITAYKEAHELVPEKRDDLAILMVAERLPAILSEFIANPVVEDQRLDEGWTAEQRAEFVAEAQRLLWHLQNALLGTDDPHVAIANLTSIFGPRIPDDPDLISQETMTAPSQKAFGAPNILRTKAETEELTATLARMSDQERYRRAELAAQEAESRGNSTRPWCNH